MAETEPYAKRSFGSGSASPTSGDDKTDSASIEEVEREPASTKAIITTVVLFVLTLGCFIVGIGVVGGEPTVSEDEAQEIYALNKQISAVQADAESLPAASDAERNLVRAHNAASDVAKLQNDYRMFAVDVAANKGVLEPEVGQATSRALTPYFAPSVEVSQLDPWYLLSSDANADVGLGIPETFDSGFTWQAQAPTVINRDSTVSVTWLAVETRTNGDREPAVLGWAQAEYDMTRQVFSDVRVGTTATGKALALEVKR